MPAEYDFYSNPVPPGSNRKPRLHARIVTKGTVGTEKLAEERQMYFNDWRYPGYVGLTK